LPVVLMLTGRVVDDVCKPVLTLVFILADA
jgi:hypothetical protein